MKLINFKAYLHRIRKYLLNNQKLYLKTKQIAKLLNIYELKRLWKDGGAREIISGLFAATIKIASPSALMLSA